MSEPNSLYFQVTKYTSTGGYEHVRVVVKAGRAVALTDAVSDCQAGKRYHDADVNERVAGQLQELSSQGFKTLFDHYSGDLYLCVEWQVFEREPGKTKYCRPNFESLGQEFTQIEEAHKLLRKIGSRIETVRQREAQKRHTFKVSKGAVRNSTFESADEFVEALKFLKAVQVRTVEFGRFQSHEVAA